MGKAQNIDKQLGENLQAIRKAWGYSQSALGASLSPRISFQQIQKYERGKNRISASVMWQISQILHTPIIDFFKGLDHGKKL